MKKLTYKEFTGLIQKLGKNENSKVRNIKDFCHVTGYSYGTVTGWHTREFIPGVAQSWIELYEENLKLKAICRQYFSKYGELQSIINDIGKIEKSAD